MDKYYYKIASVETNLIRQLLICNSMLFEILQSLHTRCSSTHLCCADQLDSLKNNNRQNQLQPFNNSQVKSVKLGKNLEFSIQFLSPLSPRDRVKGVLGGGIEVYSLAPAFNFLALKPIYQIKTLDYAKNPSKSELWWCWVVGWFVNRHLRVTLWSKPSYKVCEHNLGCE